MAYDLMLSGGRVIDPGQNLDAKVDVAFAEGRVAAVGPNLARDQAKSVRDVSGRIVTPGLIDLHTHVYWGGTSLGVDPMMLARRSAVATLVDAGSAGPAHCFRPFPNAPVHGDGRMRDEVLAARDRGVVFDIGHGQGSLGFRTARAALAAGFEPDVISSDVHQLSLGGPAFDLLVTMSKFLSLGMSLNTVVRCTTPPAATALRRPDLASLKPGAPADASVLEPAP